MPGGYGHGLRWVWRSLLLYLVGLDFRCVLCVLAVLVVIFGYWLVCGSC